jgi:DNA gyrase subunit A
MAKKEDNSKKEEPVVHQGVISIDVTDEMKESYLAYSMSVIVSRALPDVRDGLKPVHRRILYAMHEMGLSASSRFKKSAAVVGDVLGKYHPHGDSSVYDAMVKMTQDFVMRYPMVIGQGNFGSIDGDSQAAMRYTEAKMSRYASEMLRDIEKETVDWSPTYDGSKKEPRVLPAGVPNLLVNGTTGIAVGMATNIPPHNLREIVSATIHLIQNPDATNDDLMAFVKGPDFPTGAIIFGEKDMRQAYATGRGGVVCRGEVDAQEQKNGSYHLIITSIPYRVNKASLIMKIAELVQEKKLDGIKQLRDESTRDIRVVIELKNGVVPQRVINHLYKYTELQSSFHFNMVALVDGIPQTLSLRDILSEFILHREVVIRRRSEFDLRKAEDRAHILEGLTKALDNIDAVIKTIKASKDTAEAKVNLIKKFKFSELQAQAILDMRLQKLAGLERKALEDELKEKKKLIKELQELLASVKKMRALITTELEAVVETYGDERKTRVIKKGALSISDEDLVPVIESVLVFTRGGYVKRTNPDEYKRQNRGGVGVIDLDTKEEDVVTHLVTTNTHADVLFFSDAGKAYQIKMYELPEGRRATKGKSIMNHLSLSSDERVTSILPIEKDASYDSFSLLFITKQGTMKKVSAEQFKTVRANGLIAINLSDGDELFAVLKIKKGDDVIVATSKGQSIRFSESDIRLMGRTAGGVRGMKLGKGDTIIGSGVIPNDKESREFLVVSENGYGKRTDVNEYKQQKRGGSGIKTAQVTAKTGPLVTAHVVGKEDEELIAVSQKGQVIRIGKDDISVIGRQTQGVRIMKLRAGDSVASATIL